MKVKICSRQLSGESKKMAHIKTNTGVKQLEGKKNYFLKHEN